MKRTPLKRRTPLRSRRKPAVNQPGREEWKAPQVGFCECGCGRYSPHLHRHHVLLAQRIVREGKPELLWDQRNAMLLAPDCHMAHHSGMRKVHLSQVPEEALAFCCDVIGLGATADYMRRRYDCDVIE